MYYLSFCLQSASLHHYFSDIYNTNMGTKGNRILSLMKKMGESNLILFGYIVFSLTRTRTTFYIFISILVITVFAISLELSIYYKQNRTIKGALTGYKWFSLIIYLLAIIVAIIAPTDEILR